MTSSKNALNMFFDNVYASPQQVAIELNEQMWTYSELLANMTRIACHIEIEQGEIIYQYVERSLEMVCGLLSIMCVGGIYCPLNSANPSTYIRSLLDTLPGRFVLLHGKTRDRFPNTSSQSVKLIDLDQIFSMNIQIDVIQKEIYLTNDSPCIITITSGTTGEPKAIVHTHGSFVGSLRAMLKCDIHPGGNFLQVASSSWGVHLFEILLPLISVKPGTSVLLQQGDNLNMARFCKTIKEKEITFLFIGSSLLKVFLDYLELNIQKSSEILGQLRNLWTAGEVYKPQDLARFKSFALQTRIFLAYGMSETFVTIGNSLEKNINECSDLTVLPIGHPLPGYRCLLVDEVNGQIIASSTSNKTGQIYIAGPGVFHCYYNKPELTNKVRVTIDNQLYFKTGDLAQYNAQGELVYVGRIDFQIKIRGQLIEPHEIELVLMKIVTDCVIIKATHLGDDYLVAYVKTTHEPNYLRQHCLSYLPLYKVPSLFMIVDQFPMNQNGKLDRNALPSIDFSLLSISTSTDEQPRTEMEKQVHSLWCQVFPHINFISTSRSLFELGGNSISLMKLSHLYQTTFKQNVNISDLFRQSTIIEHARLLEQNNILEDEASVSPPLNLI